MGKKSHLIRRVAKPYFILLAVILAFVTAVSYAFYISYARQDTENDARGSAGNVAALVKDYVDELGFIANQVNRQSGITGIFYETKSTASPDNLFDRNVLASIDVSSALLGLIKDHAQEYNICIYNGSGDYISSQTYMTDKEACAQTLSSLDFGDVVSTIEKNGGMLVEGPSKNVWSISKNEYITVRIALKNELVSNANGIIEVRGRTDRYDFTPYLRDLDSARGEIRHRISENVLYSFGADAVSGNTKTVSEPIPGTEWEVRVEYRDPIDAAFFLRMLGIFTLAFIVLMGFVMIVTYSISRAVTRPILQLARRVTKINSPDEQLEPLDDAPAEIKELENSFDDMLERVNRSATQEKKAYSLALQAQMNPHFLYNTLSIIGAAGEEAGAANVTDMCVRLSDMLRYVASYEKVTVPLRDEVAHTTNYLSLMKSRYEDYFEYSVSVDEGLMNMAVPKLFIQPLAENCFKHGFKMSPQPWRVDIRMHGDQSHWELTIKDNGVGITDERIAELRKKIDGAIDEMSLSDIGGVGLVNTIVRLKMTHTKRLDYSIRSSGGTIIKIVADAE